jgi:small neutral amino acid transporter SnatA (MarC family)
MPVNLAFLGFMVFIFAGENIMKFFLIHFSPASVRIVLENLILIHRGTTMCKPHTS